MNPLKAAVKYVPRPVIDLFRRRPRRAAAVGQVAPAPPPPPAEAAANVGPVDYHARHRDHAQNEYADRYDFLRKSFIALKFNGIAGDYAEFGCCGAMTFCMAYRLLTDYSWNVGPCHLWAFDSFEGLPAPTGPTDAHPYWQQGTMATALDEFHALCSARDVPRSAYTAIPGFYQQSLDPSAPGPRPDKIRLAYIDCDLHSSTQEVLRFLMPRLQPGMILAFDYYYCFSDALPSGERLAAAEAFADNPTWRLLPYVQFGWHGMSFIVDRVGKGIPSGNHGAHW